MIKLLFEPHWRPTLEVLDNLVIMFLYAGRVYVRHEANQYRSLLKLLRPPASGVMVVHWADNYALRDHLDAVHSAGLIEMLQRVFIRLTFGPGVSDSKLCCTKRPARDHRVLDHPPNGAIFLSGKQADRGRPVVKLHNVSRDQPVAWVEVADNFSSRLFGLMFRRFIFPDQSLWLPDSGSLHMFFMRFPIAVAWLGAADADGYHRVLRIDRLRPWRDLAFAPPGSVGALEAHTDLFKRLSADELVSFT